MRSLFLIPTAVMVLLGCTAARADDGKLWLVKDHLKLPLRPDEVPESGCGHLRRAFFEGDEPGKAVEALFKQADLARKELRALAQGVSLGARKKEKDVQADGRVALLWWDMQTNRYRRSSAAKDNTFNPDTDRLVAALAVLDSAAVADGKWLDREEEWKLPLPARWTTPRAEGGFGFPEDWLRTQAVGPSLGGITLISAGDFTGEQLGWDGYRGAAEDRIAVWMRKHPDDRVVLLIVYEYDPDHNPRCPAGYRYYAVSATGSLDVQISAGIGTSKRGIELTRDNGEVIYNKRIK
jgi:hypothetical protein